ncbi:MAG: FG-GAP repeat protein [Pseudomonadota bacterium]
MRTSIFLLALLILVGTGPSHGSEAQLIVPPAPTAPAMKGGGATISGTVFTELGNPAGTFPQVIVFNGSGTVVADGFVDFNDGTYSINVAPGTYFVGTNTGPFPNDGAIDVVFPDLLCPGGANALIQSCDPTDGDPVNVTPGNNTVNFMLPTGGRVVGNVVERTTGFNSTFAQVRYFDQSGSLVAFSGAGISRTFQEVTYGAHAVPPGDYFIGLGMTGFGDKIFPDIPCDNYTCDVTQGTPVTITTGDNSRADFVLDILPSLGAIAGVVTGIGGSGSVQAFDDMGFSTNRATAFSLVGAPQAGYVIAGLTPGVAYARYSEVGIEELYQGVPCGTAASPGCNPLDGTPIDVVAGQITMGIGFTPSDAFFLQRAPADPDPGDRLGNATAVDGSLIAVGQPEGAGGGQVMIFRVEGQALIEDATIPVPAGRLAAGFGGAVALDGGRLLVGADGSAALRAKGEGNALQAALFERTAQGWDLKEEFASDGASGDDEFGAAVALSGTTAIIGAPMDQERGSVPSGAFYAFTVSAAGTITDSRKFKPGSPVANGRFGGAVAAQGGSVVVGAPGGAIGQALTGAVTLYEGIAGNLASLDPTATVNGSASTAGDDFGSALSLEGSMLVVGAPEEGPGAAYTFDLNAGVAELDRLTGTATGDAGFGAAVALGPRGVVVGAPGSDGNRGRVFRFDDAGNLSETLLPPDEGLREFGAAVSAGQRVVAIGAPGTDAAAGAALAEFDLEVVFSASFE